MPIQRSRHRRGHAHCDDISERDVLRPNPLGGFRLDRLCNVRVVLNWWGLLNHFTSILRLHLSKYPSWNLCARTKRHARPTVGCTVILLRFSALNEINVLRHDY